MSDSYASKYTVWIDAFAAEYVLADLVVPVSDKVFFYLNGQEVKVYNRETFFKLNPQWKPLENTD